MVVGGALWAGGLGLSMRGLLLCENFTGVNWVERRLTECEDFMGMDASRAVSNWVSWA